jgi:hypothetical protein
MTVLKGMLEGDAGVEDGAELSNDEYDAQLLREYLKAKRRGDIKYDLGPPLSSWEDGKFAHENDDAWELLSKELDDLGLDKGEAIAIVKRERGTLPHQLESWWETGKGAAQIKWGTKGSFDRCVRLAVEKAEMTPESAKGFCAKRHHGATGKWPNEGKEQIMVTEARQVDADGLDDSWDDLSDLPDLTGLDVTDFEAVSEPESKAEVNEDIERGRFAKLAKSLAAKGAQNAKALAAFIGRKKYGKKAFQAMASAARKKKSSKKDAPPRDPLYRFGEKIELEWPRSEDGMPTLNGHFAVFNRWTEINSIFEGHFMERISPGAFSKTFQENRDHIRVLFQHGRDNAIGDKPLGPIDTLEEDDVGARYEVPMLDTAYNRELIPGLKANLYGASFRMRVTREDMVLPDHPNHPGPSDYNPDGLPERDIKEIACSEFGPVTFPAYKTATAGVRSITDEMLALLFTREPERFLELIRAVNPDLFEKVPKVEAPKEEPKEPERDEPKELPKLTVVKRRDLDLERAYARIRRAAREADRV